MCEKQELKENSLLIANGFEYNIEKSNEFLQTAFGQLSSKNKKKALISFQELFNFVLSILFQVKEDEFLSDKKELMREKLSLLDGILKIAEYNIMKILNIDDIGQIVFHCLGFQYNDSSNHVVTFYFEKSNMFLAIDDMKYPLSLTSFSLKHSNQNECIRFLLKVGDKKRCIYIKLPKIEHEILLQLKVNHKKTNSKSNEIETVTPHITLFTSMATVKFFNSELTRQRKFSISASGYNVCCYIGSLQLQLYNKDDIVFCSSLNCFHINDKYASIANAKICVWLDYEKTNNLKKMLETLFSNNQCDTKRTEVYSTKNNNSNERANINNTSNKSVNINNTSNESVNINNTSNENVNINNISQKRADNNDNNWNGQSESVSRIINCILNTLPNLKVAQELSLTSTIMSNIRSKLISVIPSGGYNGNKLSIILKIAYLVTNVLILFSPQAKASKLVIALIQILQSPFFLSLIDEFSSQNRLSY